MRGFGVASCVCMCALAFGRQTREGRQPWHCLHVLTRARALGSLTTQGPRASHTHTHTPAPPPNSMPPRCSPPLTKRPVTPPPPTHLEGALLEAVGDPVRAYLRRRPDTIRAIVSLLTADGGGAGRGEGEGGDAGGGGGGLLEELGAVAAGGGAAGAGAGAAWVSEGEGDEAAIRLLQGLEQGGERGEWSEHCACVTLWPCATSRCSMRMNV